MNLKELNLKEISYIQELFGIEKNGSNFRVKNGISSQKIFNTFVFLRKEIWNNENVKESIDLTGGSGSNKILYSPPSYLVPIDDFVGKVGIMDHQILILDPLSQFLSPNPENIDSWVKDPDSYLPYLLESSLFLVSLAPWIEADIVRLVPDIPLWDFKVWHGLADLNGKIMDSKKLQTTPQYARFQKVSRFETMIKFVSEFLRTKQENYSIEDIKKLPEFNGITEEEIKKILEAVKNTPKIERDKLAINISAEENKIDRNDPVYLDYLNRFPQHQVFDVENYLDITKLKSTLIVTRGLTLTHGIHIGDRLDAVIATDDQMQNELFKLYSDAITLKPEYSNQQELVKSKVDLYLPFFEGINPDFIAQQKSQGKTGALKQYLDTKWMSIKNSATQTSYLGALNQFESSINNEYKSIKEDLDNATKQALIKSAGGLAASATIFMTNIAQHNFWYAVATSIPTLFGGILKGIDQYQSIESKLKKNPLFIFIKRKI